MFHFKTWFLILIAIGSMSSPLVSSGQSLTAASRAFFEERNFEAAKKILVTIAKNNAEYAEAQYYLGRIAVEERQYDLSVEKFEEAIATNPRVVEYHNWLGVMYGVVAMNANALKQAYLAPRIRNEFEISAKLDPHNIQTQWGLINYYVKAPGFLGGSWDKALACADVIGEHDKAQGLRALAFVHAAQNKTELAEKEYLAAVNEQPSNFENTFALAQFYHDQKNYEKAFALYESVIKKYPGNMVASFHYGLVSAHSGLQIEKGITCLNQYLGYTPRPNEPAHADANLGLAIIYEKKGDTIRAKKYYETSLQLHPGLREAKKALERLN